MLMSRLAVILGAALLCIATTQSASADLVLSVDFDNASDLGAGNWLDFQDRGGSTIDPSTGLVSGSVTSVNDVQIRSDFNLGLDASLFGPGSFVEVRFRETSNGSSFLNAANFETGAGRLFGGQGVYTSPGANNSSGTNGDFGPAFSVVDDTDNFVVARYDLFTFLNDGLGRSGLNSLRFDPIAAGAATGATFDLDSISVTAVPEPSSFAMVGLGSLGLLRRRRR